MHFNDYFMRSSLESERKKYFERLRKNEKKAKNYKKKTGVRNKKKAISPHIMAK